MKNYFKTAILLFSSAIFITSCTKKDDEVNPFDQEETKKESQLDKLSDDVTDIIDNQFEVQSTTKMSSIAGKNVNLAAAPLPSILPACATVTTVLSPTPSATVSPTTWIRTIDFGTTGCAVFNGAVLKGKLIVSGSLNYLAQNQTLSYSFDGFKYNDIAITGNKTVTRSIQATTLLQTPHPVATITLDLTATYPNGNVYNRVGSRTREMVEGFTTPAIRIDNVFKVTGSWTTNAPNGNRSVSISSPLKIVIACQYKLVEGTITLVKNNNNAVINYGDGTCDNQATISINGGPANAFTF